MMSGFVGFLSHLKMSASWEVRMMETEMTRDAGSLLAGNIWRITKEFGVRPKIITLRKQRSLC